MNQNNYPIDAFPSIVNNLYPWGSDDKYISPAIIGHVALSVMSLLSQSFVNVIPPYASEPEPCSIFCMTIAESGEGKTTVTKKLMKPFNDFSLKMEQEYKSLLEDYKQNDEIWMTINKGLKSSLKRAIKKGEDTTSIEEELKVHFKNRPQRPSHLKQFYENTTPKDLIEGLHNYPYATVFSDEAITFFNGFIRKAFGMFNKSWDGDPYRYSRPDEEFNEIRPYITLSLMAQPSVFMEYLNNHGKLFKDSGFASRFLYSEVSPSHNLQYVSADNSHFQESVNSFHARISELQNKLHEQFINKDWRKISLTLTEEAKSFLKAKKLELDKKTKQGGDLENTKDAVAKFGSNVIRLSGIFHHFNDEVTNEISLDTVSNACKIVEWHIQQMNQLFYPTSKKYRFEKDVYDLSVWIKNRFNNPKGEYLAINAYTGKAEKFKIGQNMPFSKNDILTSGPGRLRNTEMLTPVLEQLISMGLITIIKYLPNGAHYISPSLVPVAYNSTHYISGYNSSVIANQVIIVSDKNNTKGKHGDYSKVWSHWNVQ